MRYITHAVTAIALLAGCGDQTPTEASTGADAMRAPVAKAELSARSERGALLAEQLATLRRLTAPFHDFQAASAAGWSTQITPCMVDPAGTGGMGFHYGNTAFIDGTARVERPQLLLYEPEGDGRLRLVAVEYIIPYSFHPRDAAPPVLFGQPFLRNDTFQLWGLHVWIWQENPSGLFTNWNPRVSCARTTDAVSMFH